MKQKITKVAVIAVCSVALGTYAFAGGKGNSNGASHSAGHGNSAFGHQQGNAATRVTGSANSSYGKDKAAAAQPSPSATPGS